MFNYPEQKMKNGLLFMIKEIKIIKFRDTDMNRTVTLYLIFTACLVVFGRLTAQARDDFLNDLGVLEMQAGDLTAAKANFKHCLLINPQNQKTVNNLAMCRFLEGEETASLLLLTQSFSPAIAYNNMGGIYLSQGHLQKAVDMFQKALEVDPDLDTAKQNLRKTKESSQGDIQ